MHWIKIQHITPALLILPLMSVVLAATAATEINHLKNANNNPADLHSTIKPEKEDSVGLDSAIQYLAYLIINFLFGDLETSSHDSKDHSISTTLKKNATANNQSEIASTRAYNLEISRPVLLPTNETKVIDVEMAKISNEKPSRMPHFTNAIMPPFKKSRMVTSKPGVLAAYSPPVFGIHVYPPKSIHKFNFSPVTPVNYSKSNLPPPVPNSLFRIKSKANIDGSQYVEKYEVLCNNTTCYSSYLLEISKHKQIAMFCCAVGMAVTILGIMYICSFIVCGTKKTNGTSENKHVIDVEDGWYHINEAKKAMIKSGTSDVQFKSLHPIIPKADVHSFKSKCNFTSENGYSCPNKFLKDILVL